MNDFQERLMRCAKDCEARVKDKMPADPANADMTVLQGQFETCLVKCADTHVDMLPALKKRLETMFRKL